MRHRVRHAFPVVSIAAVQLAWLAQGAMLGCTFEPGAYPPVDDDKDAPNFYACQCDCSMTADPSVRVQAALDDAEQALLLEDNDGATDLDFGSVPVGVRFANVTVPSGALITSAAIQFTADASFLAPNTGALNLDVYAVAAANAPTFGADFTNLVVLPRTIASTGWMVPAWSMGQSGSAQRTPDLAAILNEVINTPGWTAGNAVALIFTGSGGRREAESFNGTAGRAPLLELTYVATTRQDFDTCMPPAINPNTSGNGAPTYAQLQGDCQGRVEDTISALATTCQYPPQCECGAIVDSQGFNAACNDPCVEVPLGADCSNFDPIHNPPTATNTGDTLPVCVAARRATGGAGPAAISAAAFGQLSACAVEGPATIEVGDESKESQAHGTVGFVGEPCPGDQCSVGVTYDFALDPITFAVRFHSDPTFEDLTSSGASSDGAALVGPSGFGTLAGLSTDSSLRGRRDDDTRAYVTTNADPVGVFVDWEDHTCALFGTVVSVVDGETEGDESLQAELSVAGDLLNQPPHADAGPDRTVECTSSSGATVVLDGSQSRDPDGNLALLAWTRDSRVGAAVGSGARVEVELPVGGATSHVLRALDTFGQSDEDAASAQVIDSVAPALYLAPTLAVLWPPTHKLISVHVNVAANDLCDESPTIRLVSISSNEGELADGAGHASPDIDGAQFGTDDRDVLLRAERNGSGTGRTYTLTYEVQDDSGNVARQIATVTVPRAAS